MPTLKPRKFYFNFVDFLQAYTSRTQNVVKMPLNDSICLNILQVLKLIFAKINKRGVQSGPKNFLDALIKADAHSD